MWKIQKPGPAVPSSSKPPSCRCSRCDGAPHRCCFGEEQKHELGRLQGGRIGSHLPPNITFFLARGGISPLDPEAVIWLDSIFSESYAEARLRTGTVRNTSHRHTLFYQSLMVTFASSSADTGPAQVIK